MIRLDPATLAQFQAIAADIRRYTGDDEVSFFDTLDGETPALEMLDRLIAEAQEAAAMEEAARELAQRTTRRAQMFRAHADGARKAMLLLMTAIGERKVIRPGATLSVSAGRTSLEVTDPASVPSQLRKPGEPDKAAIKRQMEAGEDVPGCRIVTGEATIVMRVS